MRQGRKNRFSVFWVWLSKERWPLNCLQDPDRERATIWIDNHTLISNSLLRVRCEIKYETY